jgi:hypothetical protein
VSTNTNSSRQHRGKQRKKQKKIGIVRHFKHKRKLLRISVLLQTAFAAEESTAEEATEHGKLGTCMF